MRNLAVYHHRQILAPVRSGENGVNSSKVRASLSDIELKPSSSTTGFPVNGRPVKTELDAVTGEDIIEPPLNNEPGVLIARLSGFMPFSKDALERKGPSICRGEDEEGLLKLVEGVNENAELAVND